MSDLQYKLTVKDNQIVSEEGSFFRAVPFLIKINEIDYHVTFEKGSDGHVVYHIRFGDTPLIELNHPDYVPQCKVDELNSFLNTDHAETLFFVFVYLGIAIDKDYKEALSVEHKTFLNLEVVQHFYF